MTCVGRSGGAGASTSPPRATRCGQYVNRPVGSCGPTIRPGRTTSARSPKTSRDGLLAERLQRPVALVGHLVVGQLAELGDRALLVVRRREVRVDGDARDEAVAARSRRAPRPRRERRSGGSRTCRSRRPTSRPLERREVAGAVADDPLDLGIELRIRRAAVEERQLVAALERGVGDRAAEEPRPAEERAASRERGETVEQAVDLVLGVVVDDARAHGAVLEAEVLHRLDRVVVAVPDGDVALGEERRDLLRRLRPGR